MTTTTDPTTTAFLSAARLDEIREDADLCREAIADGVLRPESSEPAVYDAAHRLLEGGATAMAAHLAALTAPAPADGGEALGRMVRDTRSPLIRRMIAGYPGRDTLDEEMVKIDIAIGTALDAHGYARGVAAGRSEGEAERALGNWASGALARVTETLAERDAEIARLTAELASAEQLTAAAVDTSAADRERALNAERERDALAAELAEARGSAKRWASLAERNGEDAIAHAARAAAARRDGAREEREAIRDKVDHDARFGADSARGPMLAIVDWLDSRARGEGQGS